MPEAVTAQLLAAEPPRDNNDRTPELTCFVRFPNTAGLAVALTPVQRLGSFSSNSLQQSRLVAIAPALAAATVALNTSVVYLGQAIGAGLGGWLIAGGATPIIAWTACSLTIAALLVSVLAQRFTES